MFDAGERLKGVKNAGIAPIDGRFQDYGKSAPLANAQRSVPECHCTAEANLRDCGVRGGDETIIGGVATCWLLVTVLTAGDGFRLIFRQKRQYDCRQLLHIAAFRESGSERAATVPAPIIPIFNISLHLLQR